MQIGIAIYGLLMEFLDGRSDKHVPVPQKHKSKDSDIAGRQFSMWIE